jgi:hypothetical protein
MGRLRAQTVNTVAIGTITSNQSTSATQTFSHTVPSGTNRALLVLIGTHQGTISTVSWNGAALTKIDSGRSSLNECADAWILINPTPATGNVVVTRSGGSWSGTIAVNLTNVLQSVPTRKATASGLSQTASINITPLSDFNLMVCAIATETTMTPALGITNFVILAGQSFEQMRGVYIAAVDRVTKTFSFALAAGKRFGMVAVAIEQAVLTETNNRTANSFDRTTAGTRGVATL